MVTRTILIALFAIMLLAAGCNQTPIASEPTLYEQLKNQIVATCDGCDTRMAFVVSPDDIITARDPSGGNELFLTVVGPDGKVKECCKKPMRLKLDEDGKAILKCPHCGKLKPIAVRDGKVFVE